MGISTSSGRAEIPNLILGDNSDDPKIQVAVLEMARRPRVCFEKEWDFAKVGILEEMKKMDKNVKGLV